MKMNVAHSTIVAVFFCIPLFAQMQKTVNFTIPYATYDMTRKGDDIFLAGQGGVLKVNTVNGVKQMYTAANTPMLRNEIKTAYIDKAGNYWFGGLRLIKYDGTQWTRYYDFPNGDTLADAWRITEGKNGKIYCNNYNNEIYIFDSSGYSTVSWNQFGLIGLPEYDIDTTGSIWLTGLVGPSGEWKVVKYDGTNATYYDTTWFGFNIDGFKNIRVDKNNVVWLTLKKAGAGVFEFFKIQNGILSQINDPVATRAAAGSLYIGDNGNKYFYNIQDTVFVYNDTTWTTFTYSNGNCSYGFSFQRNRIRG